MQLISPGLAHTSKYLSHENETEAWIKKLSTDVEYSHVFYFFKSQALAGHLLCHPVWCALHDIRHLRYVPQSLLPLPRQRPWGLQAAFAEDRELLRPQRVPAGVASHRPAHYPAACHTGEEGREGVVRKSREVFRKHRWDLVVSCQGQWLKKLNVMQAALVVMDHCPAVIKGLASQITMFKQWDHCVLFSVWHQYVTFWGYYYCYCKINIFELDFAGYKALYQCTYTKKADTSLLC